MDRRVHGMRDKLIQLNTLRCPTKSYRWVFATGMAKNVDLHSLCEWDTGPIRSDNLPWATHADVRQYGTPHAHLGVDEAILHDAQRANTSSGPALLCGIGPVRIAQGETPERLDKSHVDLLL